MGNCEALPLVPFHLAILFPIIKPFDNNHFFMAL
jgi:hypothetical protein